MDANTSTLIVSTTVAVLSILFAAFMAWRYRGIPATHEQQLEHELESLRQALLHKDSRIEALTAILADQQHQLTENRTRLSKLEADRIADRAEIANLRTQLARFGQQAERSSKYRKKQQLSGEQLRTLREALLSAYNTQADWRLLLSDIDHALDLDALGDNLTDVAAKVLSKANQEGWIAGLMAAAADKRPQRNDLAAVIDTLLKSLEM